MTITFILVILDVALFISISTYIEYIIIKIEKKNNDKDHQTKFLIYVWLRPALHKDSFQFPLEEFLLR
jgi:hypothetical protein